MTDQTRNDLVEDFARYQNIIQHYLARLSILSSQLSPVITTETNILLLKNLLELLKTQYQSLQSTITV